MRSWSAWRQGFIATAGVWALTGAYPAFAQPPEAAILGRQGGEAEPGRERATRALDVLTRHCAACHERERLEIPRAAGRLSRVLSLETLAQDPMLVRPGNPDGSQLYTMMLTGDMPPPAGATDHAATKKPTAAEIQVVRDWIAGLAAPAAAACEAPAPLGAAEIDAAVLHDLDGASAELKRRRRYLSLAHLAADCWHRPQLELYAAGLSVALNSVSRARRPVKLAPVENSNTLFRFELDELGWEAAQWERMVAAYPYAVAPADPSTRSALLATGSPQPMLRGDWLAFAVLRSPLYSELLGLPATLDALEHKLGLAEPPSGMPTVEQASITTSRVGPGMRLLQRRSTADGYVWRTVDFPRGRTGVPEPERPTAGAISGHAGSSVIFSLPNGLPGFFLADAEGRRLDAAPASHLVDAGTRDGAVRVAASCVACHTEGIRNPFTGTAAQPGPTPAASDGGPSVLGRLADSDRLLTLQNYAEAGAASAADGNGAQSWVRLAEAYARNLSFAQAMIELGVSEAQFLRRTAGVGGHLQLFSRRLLHGDAPRAEFERMFGLLLGWASADAPLAPAAGDGVMTFASAPARIPDLALVADRSSYAPGDEAHFTVASEQPCRLTLIAVDPHGRATVLVPNEFQKTVMLAAGDILAIPSAEAGFRFRFRERGKETVIAICGLKGKSFEPVAYDFERQNFPDLGDWREFVRRVYGGEMPIQQPRPSQRHGRLPRRVPARPPTIPERHEKPAWWPDELRTAITIEVR